MVEICATLQLLRSQQLAVKSRDTERSQSGIQRALPRLQGVIQPRCMAGTGLRAISKGHGCTGFTCYKVFGCLKLRAIFV